MTLICRFFFFNDTATTEIYTLSLHDALPISASVRRSAFSSIMNFMVEIPFCWLVERETPGSTGDHTNIHRKKEGRARRSEEHTSELQSRQYLVCRLLLEKKNNNDLRLTL